jgi:hypothetical protein
MRPVTSVWIWRHCYITAFREYGLRGRQRLCCSQPTLKLRGLSLQANYTDRVTAACRRSYCPNFADRGSHAVSVTDPYDRILDFLDRSRYFFFLVALQLYSRRWEDPVPDPLCHRKSGSAGNRTRTHGSVARNMTFPKLSHVCATKLWQTWLIQNMCLSCMTTDMGLLSPPTHSCSAIKDLTAIRDTLADSRMHIVIKGLIA